MVVGKKKLYRRMLVTPRLNLKCDDVKMKLAYKSIEKGNGWIIQNFNNDGKTEWYKDKSTIDVVEMIFDKYEDVNITWSRAW